MSMNETPSGERVQIGFFGARNAGKSSLVNAVAGQRVSIVSDTRGTTTDPVRKAMELLPLGPVVLIDTPGFDDTGELGALRVERTKDILSHCDIAVLVVDASLGLLPADAELMSVIKEREIPYLVAWNKCDRGDALTPPPDALPVSSVTREGIQAFKEHLSLLSPRQEEKKIVSDLLSPGDTCVLVCPIDASAPKGRLILPQQQVIRELLEEDIIAVVAREANLAHALTRLSTPPALVITDSQAFREVDRTVPPDIPLTSFSILMARYKGFLETAVAGIDAIKDLEDGSRVLMAEGCTHHRQCNDIGTVKIPSWLRAFTHKQLTIDTCSGRDFPQDLSPYQLIVHCGGCMLTENMVKARMARALRQGIPFTNYGTVIAAITGALDRSLALFPSLRHLP